MVGSAAADGIDVALTTSGVLLHVHSLASWS